VQPKGRKNSLVKVENGRLKIKVTQPPEGGKANKAVLKILSKELKIPVSSFEIIKGINSRIKVILINHQNIDEIEKKLQKLANG